MKKFARLRAETVFQTEFSFDWASGKNANPSDSDDTVVGGYQGFMEFTLSEIKNKAKIESKVSSIIKYVFSAALA